MTLNPKMLSSRKKKEHSNVGLKSETVTVRKEYAELRRGLKVGGLCVVSRYFLHLKGNEKRQIFPPISKTAASMQSILLLGKGTVCTEQTDQRTAR